MTVERLQIWPLVSEVSALPTGPQLSKFVFHLTRLTRNAPPPPFFFGPHICHNCLPRFFLVAICLLLFAVAPRRQPVPPATISSPASALAPPPVIFWWLNIPASKLWKVADKFNQPINQLSLSSHPDTSVLT